MTLSVSQIKGFHGEFRPPPDKSITHRAYMLAAIANGKSVVRNPLRGDDCEATLRCLGQMGLACEWVAQDETHLTPVKEWKQPNTHLDCGNSGTTMRLLSGLIASRPISAVLIGDESLSRRPMKRITEPLRLMGATVEGESAPLRITGSDLSGIDYELPVASAQVKSCVLLAGLRASGTTTILERTATRDHTERMLRATGVPVTSENGRIAVTGGSVVEPPSITVPGDISSAAFFILAASMFPGSKLSVLCVGVNPTRAGLLNVLTQCGVNWSVEAEQVELGEPVADVEIEGPTQLSSFTIEGDLVPRLIDEMPVLAVLATQCEGTSLIKDAKELRVKESDRIETMAKGLRKMGAKIESFSDGMAITGPTPLRCARIDATGDHRVGMAFAIAALIADGTTEIEGAESIQTSFPGFESELRRLCVA